MKGARVTEEKLKDKVDDTKDSRVNVMKTNLLEKMCVEQNGGSLNYQVMPNLTKLIGDFYGTSREIREEMVRQNIKQASLVQCSTRKDEGMTGLHGAFQKHTRDGRKQDKALGRNKKLNTIAKGRRVLSREVLRKLGIRVGGNKGTEKFWDVKS